MKSLITIAACLVSFSVAAPSTEKRAVPTVQLTNAKVIGSSLLGIDTFNGIPYAKPPVGQLRLKPPQPITSNLGTITAIGTARSCPQFTITTDTNGVPPEAQSELANSPIFKASSASAEDCLTVNVQRPSTAKEGSKLPVVFWIYGGGFEFGSTSTYDASELIRTSIAQNKDIIYVAVNYRVGGFGFLPGSEIKKDGSANLGLLDQRLGLQWVADNIAKFGGDPSKVTIWGESAGAISVFDQMALYDGKYSYNGKPLFRAAIMNSGSIVPADPVDGKKGQAVYDTVVKAAGCDGSADTLACLRNVDFQTFSSATSSVPSILSYNSVALSYLPRPDGSALTASPETLAQNGLYAPVPFIVGDQEDEGTLFSLFQFNISTTADLENYLSTIFFPFAKKSTVQGLVATYPDNPSAGSPFNTGVLNNFYPQYKRLAAILGDLSFTLTRRIFLNIANTSKPSVPNWSYLNSYFYGTPILGTFHASDILKTYGIVPGIPSSSVQAYYISFFNTMDPNQGTSILLPKWPQWKDGNQLLHFKALTNGLLKDDFRKGSYEFIENAAGELRI